MTALLTEADRSQPSDPRFCPRRSDRTPDPDPFTALPRPHRTLEVGIQGDGRPNGAGASPDHRLRHGIGVHFKHRAVDVDTQIVNHTAQVTPRGCASPSEDHTTESG